MQDLKSLLDLMFLPEDTVVVSNNKFATHSVSIETVLSGEVTLVSSNQKVSNQIVKTSELIFLAINPIKGFRLDSNAYRLQNFLLECDTGSITSQVEYLKNLGIPYSAIIFSGSKSAHILVALDTPLDEKTYRLLYVWILRIGTLFDQNCKNPSRCIRIPGATRPETGKQQTLLELKEKVKLEDLMVWLNLYEHLRPKERERKSLTNGADHDKLSPWVKTALKYGIKFDKGRNHTWHSIFCDFALAGYPKDQAIDFLSVYFVEEFDFKEKEWLRIAQSAYDKHG